MRYSIIVQALVNRQPEHIFVQHHGIHPRSAEKLFREVVDEQYERLERAGSDINFRADFQTPHGSIFMSRGFRDGSVTSVQVILMDAQRAKPYYEAQNAHKRLN